MNLVGELVIDQTRMNQVKEQLRRKYSDDEDVADLEYITAHVNRVVSDLQESIMKVRMLPIEQLFNRFPRMVRDLSQALGKEVELVLTGNETELDRSIMQVIGDPLIHLIRNALDHGIEKPAERIRKGKPAKGLLRISAAHEDNQVVIVVEDDGAGIDSDKVKQSALRKGLITPEEADRLTEQEAVQLIFKPGFSTAEQVSDISGRGVGMDIVRSDIERMNGVIDIHSVPEQGTRFRIRLPLTLAIITGLLIRLTDRTFIVPMGNVLEIVRLTADEIRTVRGKEVMIMREQVIPVIWLHDLFRIPRDGDTKEDRKIPLVIVGMAEKRAALAVDGLIGNQEVVIKSLGSFIGETPFISGATILGDGRVACILDVASILAR